MATVNTTGLYEFDPYGTSPDNKITGELQTLQTPGRDDYYFIIPQAAPFYVESFTIVDHATGRPYIEGRDFLFGHYFPEGSNATGKALAGSLRFLSRDITGVVRMTYQTIGGHWGFDDNAVLEELSNKAINPLTRAWSQIDTLPALFPPIPHDQGTGELIGFEEVVDAIGNINSALGETNAGNITDHMSNRDNPHQVTKVQVGLGQVQNFPMANATEAAEGLRSDRYMSPNATNIAVQAAAGRVIDAHVNEDNPHGTNKADVGLSLVQNYGVATSTEAYTGNRNDRYMTPFLVDVVIQALKEEVLDPHFNDTNNPHGITAADIGAVDMSVINGMLQNYLPKDGVAADTSKAFGMEFDGLQQEILLGTAADSEMLEGKTYGDIRDDLYKRFVYFGTYTWEYTSGDAQDRPEHLPFYTLTKTDEPLVLIGNVMGTEGRRALVNIEADWTEETVLITSLNGIPPLKDFAMRVVGTGDEKAIELSLDVHTVTPTPITFIPVQQPTEQFLPNATDVSPNYNSGRVSVPTVDAGTQAIIDTLITSLNTASDQL